MSSRRSWPAAANLILSQIVFNIIYLLSCLINLTTIKLYINKTTTKMAER